jgi:hypothetical protein
MPDNAEVVVASPAAEDAQQFEVTQEVLDECAYTCAHVEPCDDPETIFTVQVGARRQETHAACVACRHDNYLVVPHAAATVRVGDTVYVNGIGETVPIWYAENYYYYCDDDGEWYTERPQDEESEDGHSYSYGTDIFDHLPWPRGLDRRALCFGVELEIESNNGVGGLARALGKRGSHHILKEDGSLDSGTEIVTLPATLEQHKSGAHFNWPAMLSIAQRYGHSGAGTTNCGLHVHINRAALSPLTLGKMLVFMNDANNVPYMEVIAQRDPKRWAAFKNKKLADGRYCSETRYEALNLQERTAEVRIFRGNLRVERVFKAIEFCHAMVRFCESASAVGLSFSKFLAWVTLPAHSATYPNLIAFCREKDLLPERKTSAKFAKSTPKDA